MILPSGYFGGTAIGVYTCCCAAKATQTTSSGSTGYREQGLAVRFKRPRHNKAAKLRQPKQLAHSHPIPPPGIRNDDSDRLGGIVLYKRGLDQTGHRHRSTSTECLPP